jgi:hypothetical protein
MSKYICSLCLEIYEKTAYSDYNAAKELIENHPEWKNDPTAIVCTPCYKKFMKWYKDLDENTKKKMRTEYHIHNVDYRRD